MMVLLQMHLMMMMRALMAIWSPNEGTSLKKGMPLPGWLGWRTMAKKVAGEHEKNKFWKEYNTYNCVGEHGLRDWSIMADAWNEFVAEREKSGQNETIK